MGFRRRPIPGTLNAFNSGFTLVEIALAVGIFAFAIVAILALFPVGLRSANESRVETIVSQIARTVISDLRTPPLFTAVYNPAPNPPTITPVKNANGDQMGLFKAALIAIKNPATNSQTDAYTTTDLNQTTAPVIYLSYMADGTVKGQIKAQGYTNGDPTTDYIVKLESKLVVTSAPVLAQVTVTVEAPASAPALNRTKYPVATLMGDTR